MLRPSTAPRLSPLFRDFFLAPKNTVYSKIAFKNMYFSKMVNRFRGVPVSLLLCSYFVCLVRCQNVTTSNSTCQNGEIGCGLDGRFLDLYFLGPSKSNGDAYSVFMNCHFERRHGYAAIRGRVSGAWKSSFSVKARRF